MLFIENKKKEKTGKKQKEKSLPFLPLFPRLLRKIDICSACKVQLFADLILRTLVGVHLRTYSIAWVFLSRQDKWTTNEGS